MLHVTSDLHFFHRNICKYTQRHTWYNTVEEMNNGLIHNWNAVVRPEDTVWTLGDFAFAPFDKIFPILRRLNGQIHMIMGNHCKDIRKHPQKYLDTGLIQSIQDYKEITYEGQHIVLFHYAQRVWNRHSRGSYQLHGHSHSTLNSDNPEHPDSLTAGLTTDVGVDVPWITGQLEYRPFSFTEIQRFMKSKKVHHVDHHGNHEVDM